MKAQEREELLQALKARFEKNMHRHKWVAWANVQAKLEGNPEALRSLREMEVTGGEPDVIGQDREAGHFTFCDCSVESPIGRRSVCYPMGADIAHQLARFARSDGCCRARLILGQVL